MITVKNLVKRYGSLCALDHVSFHIDRGSAVGLLGPNGAGKSTVMNILTGNLRPDAGDATVGGYSLLSLPEEAKRLTGYLPELPPLYPELTVGEYLHYVCGLKGIPKEKKKNEADRVMEKLRIGDTASRLIRNLSKGYRQRVGISQALLGDPPVVILDEPSIGLDPRQIIEIREIVRTLKGSHTVLFSTHILAEISAVCDRVIILDHGRVAADNDLVSPPGDGQDLEAVFLRATGGDIRQFGAKEG